MGDMMTQLIEYHTTAEYQASKHAADTESASIIKIQIHKRSDDYRVINNNLFF